MLAITHHVEYSVHVYQLCELARLYSSYRPWDGLIVDFLLQNGDELLTSLYKFKHLESEDLPYGIFIDNFQ